MDSFLPGKSISKVHGQAFRQGNIIYFAMYHPAAALYQQSLADAIKHDILKLPGILAQPKENEGKDEEKQEETRQIKMF
jgi:DNA polymerase